MSDLVQFSTDAVDRVTEAGVIGIVRSPTPELGLSSARALLEAGLDVVEVSLVTPGAVDVIARLVQEYPASLVGAGTVMDRNEAMACVESGARLLVSPTLEPEVLAYAAEVGVLAIPGANTPTECMTAVRLGSPLVKLFPASTWSPASIADLRSSLPDLRLVPTGGVKLGDAQNWFAAGATALGIGSALTSGTLEECRTRVQQLHRAMAAARR